MTEPAWWPQILSATSLRRQAAGMLLAQATPSVVRGTLRLEFPRTGLVTAWRDSRAEAALEGALAHYGWAMPIEVTEA
ncbi:hypothetical protein [Streptomyces sp. NPDC050416]|uniref:hypothetical protein n=1 Tax=Streptomyces sp. NPDC050416 TaxID=3365611 RepID=UPI003797F372